MQTQPDYLNFFEQNVGLKSIFRVCGILFFVHYLLSLATFFISLKVAKIDIETLLVYKIILLQLFFVRVLPLLGLILYFSQKKVGWVFLIIYSLTDLLSKSEFVLNFIGNNKITSSVNPFLSFPILILFILSCIIFFLLLSKSIKELLNLNILLKISSIIISIAIYIFIKFYFADFLVKQMQAA